MRLSLRKAAHAAMSSAAWQEIRVRSGRDDNFVAQRELSREIVDFKTKLSSRPERSVVEGPAVQCDLSGEGQIRPSGQKFNLDKYG
jgi:hypothetical protein